MTSIRAWARLVVPACFGLLASLGLPKPAEAQYYAPPPGYYEPPPRYRALGGRCEVVLRSRFGPQREVCEIVRPRPIGRPCACPPPPPPPGYAPGPFVSGRVIP